MKGLTRGVAALGCLLAACARGGGSGVAALPVPPLPALVYRADSVVRDSVAPGALYHRLVRNDGPWAIRVLEVDRAACWSIASLKAGGRAVGRRRVSELIENFQREARIRGQLVAGGANGDFFLFAPPGVPTGASIHRGVVITGPAARPVVASDSAGRPWIGTLRVWGRLVAGSDTIPIDGWNRRSPEGVAFFDPAYGDAVDSVPGSLRVALGPGRQRRVLAVDSSGGIVPIAEGGGVVSVGGAAPPGLRSRIVAAAAAAVPFDAVVGLEPFHPSEAVGGFPVLVRDSAEVEGLDTAGGATFGPVRHPRTIFGIASGGRRLLLVTVDGRQPGYSLGMTLRESAQLMLELGATQALNLDGGGSTTMVVRRSWENAVRYDLANKPSDKEGERPVANALAMFSDATRCLTR